MSGLTMDNIDPESPNYSVKELVLRDADSPFGKIFLSWKCGELETPSWGLCNTYTEVETNAEYLRSKGHVFEIKDLREVK